MWGRLSEFVQDKLDTSSVEDERHSGDAVCINRHIFCVSYLGFLILVTWTVHIYSREVFCLLKIVFIFHQGNAKATIERLQQALSEAESRNKDINREFKKLIREKEVCFDQSCLGSFTYRDRVPGSFFNECSRMK